MVINHFTAFNFGFWDTAQIFFIKHVYTWLKHGYFFIAPHAISGTFIKIL